jgi:oligoribonuclease
VDAPFDEEATVPASMPLVWIDLEMTGLDASRDTILEIATLVTDGDLEIVAEGPDLVIHQEEAVLATMDEWNQTHHAASGLLDRVRASTLDLAQAQGQTLEFVQAHCGRGEAPLAGNSVHQDRRFLARLMPELEAHLHYRIVDVSTVKELVRRWYPAALESAPPKQESHRALQDIRESIAELRHYRKTVFRALD